MERQPEIITLLNTMIQKLEILERDTKELRCENQQLRIDLLKHTATGWQSPLVVARALGFEGSDLSVVKKMHRLRDKGTFSRIGKHYRVLNSGNRPTYQYHIENCDKALTKRTA
ncbi:hypothetical protein D0962_18805 [Leptolyngbyaceae cyanobacterium CCMR0082]|uniref:Uncharacterized protein n=1 Tax=Adonisia turfae CCMR0082 TaxID=2304604 RepID=A0A6M0S9Y2_9CYAN|nr:hypothetical protein [Adonisia turfae]NEZ64811.1 hypothetical protein [Adonisia turfae CCMR0082]